MRRSRSVAFVVAITFLLTSTAAPSAVAWGLVGHRAVGRIAERHLTPRAAEAVSALLAPEPLAYVTTWADEIRVEAQWEKRETWHWVTIPDGETYESAAKNSRGDILEAIARFEKVLGERQAPAGERVQALKWLSHLIGDLHQPLHVGRADDEGGNKVLVLWFDDPTNLHSVWDTKVIDGQRLSFSELADLVDHAPADKIREWQGSTPVDWARESQELRAACYEMGDRKLGARYAHDHWPTIQQRILQAGVRLAGELNRLLGGR
jgi:nuclease S1